VTDKRPVNLSIPTIRLPIPAYVSILHRISGVILIAALGVFLYLLHFSLASPRDFARVVGMVTSIPCKLVIGALMAALIYHSCAGVRHLVMDLGYGESLKGGVLGAQLTLGIAVVLILINLAWVMSW
jgi:succinate dehydrogenase / fumarate reductase cytochrome b subunit